MNTAEIAGYVYEVVEPDSLHPCCGWYFETPSGLIRGPYSSREAAVMENAS